MKKKDILKEVIIIFWLFVIGSLVGYILEMIVGLVQTGHFESRQGLIYGPFTPVYGIGMAMYYFILNHMKTDNKVKILNINGRTSILHCTYWGIAGVLYVMCIDPLLEKIKERINTKGFKIITTIVLILMLSNICISCVAANRQTERRKNIAPASSLDVFLDRYYSDEYMDRIYANKKEV